MVSDVAAQSILPWPIDRLIFYARNPRKNDAVVDRMCGSIREFGFKIPVLARSDGEVVDGHLRLKAARKLNIAEMPVILCDEWTPAQVKAFRIMVNRSVAWAEWDEELLSLELQELNAEEFDLSLTGFTPKEICGRREAQRRSRAAAAGGDGFPINGDSVILVPGLCQFFGCWNDAQGFHLTNDTYTRPSRHISPGISCPSLPNWLDSSLEAW